MTGGSIIPKMRYRDAAAAIAWLCEFFGFERHLIVPGEGDSIAHAQLRFGAENMIMLGSHTDDEYSSWVQPADSGQPCTQCVYIVVPNPDAHHRKAVAGGATILGDIQDAEYGGRGYTCRDPQGQIWSVGSYNPWSD